MISLAFAALVSLAAPPAPDESLAEWAADREERMLDLVEARAPERYAELLALRQTDPVAYMIALHEVGKAAKAGAGADDDPRIAEINGKIDALAVGFDALSPGEQKKRRAEIEALAGQLFDIKQELRKARLAEVQARVERLEAEIADREARRDELVDKWVDRRLAPPAK